MKKEFTVPPVIFPSGDSSFATFAGNGSSYLHQRRIPIAFQPPRPANSNIPCLSFELGPPSFSVPIYNSSTLPSSSSSSNFSDEPSLLEELEIDPLLIYRKTVSLLNPFRVNPAFHDSADLSGPILYYMSFCLFQMLAGKVQFGVVLGWIVVFSIFLYVVFNMLGGKNGNLDLYRSLSLVGYSMFPVVVLSAVTLFVPQGRGNVRMVLAAVVVLWSTKVCALLLLQGSPSDPCGCEYQGLIAYPCMLIYTLFSMLVMF